MKPITLNYSDVSELFDVKRTAIGFNIRKIKEVLGRVFTYAPYLTYHPLLVELDRPPGKITLSEGPSDTEYTFPKYQTIVIKIASADDGLDYIIVHRNMESPGELKLYNLLYPIDPISAIQSPE